MSNALVYKDTLSNRVAVLGFDGFTAVRVNGRWHTEILVYADELAER